MGREAMLVLATLTPTESRNWRSESRPELSSRRSCALWRDQARRGSSQFGSAAIGRSYPALCNLHLYVLPARLTLLGGSCLGLGGRSALCIGGSLLCLFLAASLGDKVDGVAIVSLVSRSRVCRGWILLFTSG